MISQSIRGAGAPPRRIPLTVAKTLHWLMALGFVGAYLTGDSEQWRLVHVALGYTIAGLLVARVLWGVWGPPHARLSTLGRRLQGLPRWLPLLGKVRSVAQWQAAWQASKNLWMPWIMAVILGLMWPLSLTGYAVWSEWGGEWLEETHEFFGNVLFSIVWVHVGLVVLLRRLRLQRKN